MTEAFRGFAVGWKVVAIHRLALTVTQEADPCDARVYGGKVAHHAVQRPLDDPV
jgi:hypothetical protein